MEQNEQLTLAYNFIQFTDKNIFLTGKAGTGKTTFLHQLKKTSNKRMVVVAPTGVAAINAGGVTIHSFFQLPFGPYIPGNEKNQPYKRFSRDKINLIKSLDLLVIDEISMVRADVLDGIDEVLRRFRSHNRPFGGIQLLMIGDLHQLSPVVKEDELAILRDYYSTFYFFGSRALQKTDPVNIELKHIYRQADPFFIDLLNKVRNNQIDQSVLEQLNQRYIPEFNPNENEGYITLTTHNKLAAEINEKKLIETGGKSYKFNATLSGEFPEYTYPTEPDLELKIGAQVMFVKNDPSRDRLFYNGKIGKVIRIEQNIIFIKCPGEFREILVEQLEWQNIKYDLNAENKEVEEKVIGTFLQYPIKLAWAITIHKSQGLTFEKAIIDANSAFAHGQVYVALSRCKSFEGLVLSTPISINGIKTDKKVADYTKSADDNAPTEEYFIRSKIAYQQTLIYELFDFTTIKVALYQCKKIAEDNHSSLGGDIVNDLNNIIRESENEIYIVAETFKRHLAGSFTATEIPEENTILQDRLKKACAYFNDKTSTCLYASLQKIVIETDRKAVKTMINEANKNLRKEISIKLMLTDLCRDGFSTESYLKTKAASEIDHLENKSANSQPEAVSTKIPHPHLYTTIKNWRNKLAEEHHTPAYIVLPQKTLVELVKILPITVPELATVKGMGKVKLKQYGEAILEMISSYCNENNIERLQIEPLVKKGRLKSETHKISFQLYREGRSVREVAEMRGLVISTIEGHLAHFIPTGELSVFDFVPKIKVAKIMAHLIQHPNNTLNEMKLGMGDTVSFSELKVVMQHIDFIKKNSVE